MNEYFSHDYNARNDLKTEALIDEFGAMGYGIWWAIVEILHQEKTHELSYKEYVFKAIAKQMKANAEQIKSIVDFCIKDCELLILENDKIYSERVNENIEIRSKISKIRSESGKKGAKAKQLLSKCQANDKQNLANKRKEKESKLKETKVNKIVFPFDSKNFKNQWKKWKKYRTEIKKSIKGDISEQAQLIKLSKLANGNENTAIEIINQSIENNWQGLFELKINNGKFLTKAERRTEAIRAVTDGLNKEITG